MKKNLYAVLSLLNENSGLDNSQVFGMLHRSIQNGSISLLDLKNEFEQNILENSNWIEIAKETNLLEDPTPYTNQELINYIKEWIWDYIYPEKALTERDIYELGDDATKILSNYLNNEGWMFSYDLHDLLKKNNKYSNLEYYNLWKINYKIHNLERKPIEEKEREIGYLRYKKTLLNPV